MQDLRDQEIVQILQILLPEFHTPANAAFDRLGIRTKKILSADRVLLDRFPFHDPPDLLIVTSSPYFF